MIVVGREIARQTLGFADQIFERIGQSCVLLIGWHDNLYPHFAAFWQIDPFVVQHYDAVLYSAGIGHLWSSLDSNALLRYTFIILACSLFAKV